MNKKVKTVNIIREFRISDIAFDYYTKIPPEYYKAIDYDRILERLEGKVYKILPRPLEETQKKKDKSVKKVIEKNKFRKIKKIKTLEDFS